MRKQTGFTLIEIAIVLVIIGLLLGGVLKGQELIQSARVRNLASMQDGIKAAFFGFQDRYRALPGDYTGPLAIANIGNGMAANAGCTGAVTGGGNGDGTIALAGESIIAWEHLARSGFMTGSYVCAGAAAAATNTPTNVYNSFVQLVNDAVYGFGAPASRNNVKSGASIPSAIITELDRKIDDGMPFTGSFQFSTFTGGGAALPAAGATGCTSAAAATTDTWNAANGATNCGGATLL